MDDEGRVRVAVGYVTVLDGEYEPGFVLYDEAGAERASLVLYAHGPHLSFVVDGTGVIEVYVADPGPETGIGAANLLVADGTGIPAVRYVVPLHRTGQWDVALGRHRR